jgi:hypothetical protein
MRGPRPALTNLRMVEAERLAASHAALKLMTGAFGRASPAGTVCGTVSLQTWKKLGIGLPGAAASNLTRTQHARPKCDCELELGPTLDNQKRSRKPIISYYTSLMF